MFCIYIHTYDNFKGIKPATSAIFAFASTIGRLRLKKARFTQVVLTSLEIFSGRVSLSRDLPTDTVFI